MNTNLGLPVELPFDPYKQLKDNLNQLEDLNKPKNEENEQQATNLVKEPQKEDLEKKKEAIIRNILKAVEDIRIEKDQSQDQIPALMNSLKKFAARVSSLTKSTSPKQVEINAIIQQGRTILSQSQGSLTGRVSREPDIPVKTEEELKRSSSYLIPPQSKSPVAKGNQEQGEEEEKYEAYAPGIHSASSSSSSSMVSARETGSTSVSTLTPLEAKKIQTLVNYCVKLQELIGRLKSSLNRNIVLEKPTDQTTLQKLKKRFLSVGSLIKTDSELAKLIASTLKNASWFRDDRDLCIAEISRIIKSVDKLTHSLEKFISNNPNISIGNLVVDLKSTRDLALDLLLRINSSEMTEELYSEILSKTWIEVFRIISDIDAIISSVDAKFAMLKESKNLAEVEKFNNLLQQCRNFLTALGGEVVPKLGEAAVRMSGIESRSAEDTLKGFRSYFENKFKMLSSLSKDEDTPQLSDISLINDTATELKDFIDLLVKKLESPSFRGDPKLSSIIRKLKTISNLCNRLGVIPDEVYQSYLGRLDQPTDELFARILELGRSPLTSTQLLNTSINIIARASAPSSSEIQSDYLKKVGLSIKLILTGIDEILMELTTARALIDWSSLSSLPER